MTYTAFGPLSVASNSRVLSPRPWTVLQSEWAAELSPHLPAGQILELCAGAGHIGLLAARLSARELVQVEVDPTAATFAAKNAEAAGVSVDIRNVALAAALHVDERFSLILADPPYVPSDDVALYPEDPRIAIDGGADGLSVIRECVAIANLHLCEGGVLLLQVRGNTQADEVAALLTTTWPELRVASTRAARDDRAVTLIERIAE